MDDLEGMARWVEANKLQLTVKKCKENTVVALE